MKRRTCFVFSPSQAESRCEFRRMVWSAPIPTITLVKHLVIILVRLESLAEVMQYIIHCYPTMSQAEIMQPCHMGWSGAY